MSNEIVASGAPIAKMGRRKKTRFESKGGLLPKIPALGQPMRIADIVRLADSFPEDELTRLLPIIGKKIQRIPEIDAVYIRHVLLLGAVANRIAFEMLEIAKDAGAII
jgi:hypothetical protein